MRKIGQIEYDQQSSLGRGASALVFPGNFQERRVAVKRVTIENVNDREENALNSLMNHPNVIKLFHAEQNEDFKFYALELCAASMDDVFFPAENPKYRGPLPSDLDVLLQLSEGLRYIHRQGFVHRDIKPENVLISYPEDDGTVDMKWADFGLSKSVSSGGSFSISGMRGTFNWIAPEILATLGLNESIKARGTVESDTWAFGCVIFAYLTKGKHPFGDWNINANISSGNPISISELPQDHFAGNIIKEMIQKDPAERIKLVDVVEILIKVKVIEDSSQPQQEYDDAKRELDPGQLYSWERWNFILKNGELFIWSDDVGIKGFPLFHNETARMNLNDTNKMKVVSIHPSGWSEVKEETAGRKEGELNKEMFQMVGITPGTPSKSPLNTHFVSHGKEWTICSSELDDMPTLIIKGEELRGHPNWEMILFGTSFYSMLHIVTEGGNKPTVYMTEKAKLALENELLDLCSRLRLKEKDLDRIAALLQVGVDPNCTDTDGKTPLLLSLAKQDGQTRLQCLKTLLESTSKKVDLKVKDREQRNAFELLLTKKADGGPPMVYETLKLLIDSGIDINLKEGQHRRTALHHLCKNYKDENIIEAMKLLIARGIEISAVDCHWGRTALLDLCENYKKENIVDAMKFLIENGTYANFKDGSGQTSLHYLCKNFKKENIVDAIQLLIEKDVDVESKDWAGRTALHCLCEYYNKENIADAANVLIEKGANVNSKDGTGRSVLYFFSKNHRNGNIVAVMNLLIDKGLDYKFQDQFGCTALHYICENYTNENIVDAIKLLLDKGVDVNLKDQGGQTALYYLCKRRNQYGDIIDAMKLLIDNGVDVNSKDGAGRTALHWLCENYKRENIVDVMNLLIEKGVDVNLKDTFGRTALHWVSENYKNENIVEVIKLLVDKGVDIHLEDRGGKTALDYLGIRDPKMAVWKEKFLGKVNEKTKIYDKNED